MGDLSRFNVELFTARASSVPPHAWFVAVHATSIAAHKTPPAAKGVSQCGVKVFRGRHRKGRYH
jgi:hypothetical protein